MTRPVEGGTRSKTAKVGDELRRYRLFLLIVAADVILGVIQPALAAVSVARTFEFLGNLLAIVPAVMVLVALFDVWVPRRWVEDNVGPGSGIRGTFLAVFLGSAAAGPLYAAFPVARSLQGKGARLANIVAFLGAWGTIKIPMVLIESSYVGMRFALLRLALTLPGVIGIGFLMEWLAPGPSGDSARVAAPGK